ncbi:MAG: right-handed parallel beta-helix repeat-containing protein [Crocinitomicaceae bacterium]
MKYLIIFIAVVFIGITSCKKDISFTKDHLDFSADTVLFDTVFTTVGSTTKRLKIYNRNNQPIVIDQIQLMGGENSPFRINVDGVSGDYFESIEIPANDSLYTFVEVTLEVNNGTNPLIISDSVRFLTNGLNQYVNLDVWGQDAYFHADELVSGVWANDKPHVLYNTVACGFPGLDSNLNLTIPAGTQIYCHKNAQLIVYKSSIDIQGSYGNEVVFQGDRLESFYDDVSGQWWGIRLIEANYSQINYAVIKNGSVGLQVDSTQDASTLLLENSIIDNNDFFGLNVNAGANVTVNNCLIGDAGICSVYLFAGGEYHFTHNSIVNYWAGSRSGPALGIKNYFEVENVTYCRQILNSTFENNVAFGSIDKEYDLDTLDCGVDITFGPNYFKRDEAYTYPGYPVSIQWAGDPLFTDVTMRDFHLLQGSPLIDAGVSTFVLSDIEGNARTLPDLGCYEF